MTNIVIVVKDGTGVEDIEENGTSDVKGDDTAKIKIFSMLFIFLKLTSRIEKSIDIESDGNSELVLQSFQ